MAVRLRQPILVVGVGLSFLLWILQSLHESVAHLSEFGVLGAIAFGVGCLLFQKRTAKQELLLSGATQLSRKTVEKAISLAEGMISQLEAEAQNHQVQAGLRERVPQIKAELDRQDIRLAVMGGKAVGKTTLIQVLESSWISQQPQKISWHETPALNACTKTGLEAESSATELALASDLTIFITTSDLTDSQFETLKQLLATNHRVVLVLNKQDQYLPEERATILQQLRHRLSGMIGAQDVLAIASSPIPIKVRQHQHDGSVQEWMEVPLPESTCLRGRLSQILLQEGQQLVWATTWRQAIALSTAAKTALNGIRRDRALPIIEQYQWIAAAAAFANPVPTLDVLATAAINAQLVSELGAIYQQKFSRSHAQTVAATIGSLILKLGLVELSTQAVGEILKSNAITFVAGGIVQGVSAAYLTRLAGISLIEYFQAQDATTTTDAESPLNLDQLGHTLRKVFQQNQRAAFLQSFVKPAVGRLFPESPQPETTAASTVATPL